MDYNNGGKIPSLHHHRHQQRHPHHHHVFYVSPHCALHRSILQPNYHSPSCSFSPTYPQNPESSASPPLDPQQGFPNQALDDSQMIEDETEKLEEVEEEDPIFVLTDEWRDFFAKSEAKRRIAKKQARKGKK